jgi:hypothetical protein
VQTHTIGLAGGINTFAYVGGNPVSRIDPLGLQAMAPVIAWVGVDTAVPDPTDAAWPKWAFYGGAVGVAWAIDQLAFNKKTKDGSGSKPNDCPAGTLPIDVAKKKYGWDHDDVEGIKYGVNAAPDTWTGIAPDGVIWVGTPDGSGRSEGHYGEYLP